MFILNIIRGQFYRVQVGVQSPEGIATLHGVLRRFNNFLKLHAKLKKEFLGKIIPAAPMKGLFPLKSRALLEERRCVLEELITKLLSDIEISRCASVASFLARKAAARSFICSAFLALPNFDIITSQHSNLQACRIWKEILFPMTDHNQCNRLFIQAHRCFGPDDNSEVGTIDLTLEEDMENPMEKLVKYGLSNIDEGLLMDKNKNNGNPDHSSLLAYNNAMELFMSRCMLRIDITGHSEVQFTGYTQVISPLDQHNKLNRIVSTTQRRIVSAITDREDLIVRLNQEVAAKDFHATKAILIEREKFTQMLWDMEDFRQKSLEMEMKLKSELDGIKVRIWQRNQLVSRVIPTGKSKADIKVLVKEVKSLRNSQFELKKELNESVNEKCEAEVEASSPQKRERGAGRDCLEKIAARDAGFFSTSFKRAMSDLVMKMKIMKSSSLTSPLNQLGIYDERIHHLVAEVRNLGKDCKSATSNAR
ncbi:hypothetical protein VNO77_30379 [Canavalia gladiata]|uniref:PX domain-containing protein n=1 Tax=Canavalia gladiata TaxID=3824 RepID=A0AAN9KQ78_CANGL